MKCVMIYLDRATTAVDSVISAAAAAAADAVSDAGTAYSDDVYDAQRRITYSSLRVAACMRVTALHCVLLMSTSVSVCLRSDDTAL